MSETFEWIDATGVALTISGPGVTTYQVDMPASGRYMPKTRVHSDIVPGQPGGIPRSVEHDARDFVLPLSISATSEANLRALLRDLMKRMNPKRGQGRIRVTSPIGDQREITCLYAAGLEGEEKEDVTGPQFQAFPLAFTAYDPYWYAVSSVSKTFTLGTPTVFFPVFPVFFSPSAIVASDTVVNDGDEPAQPVWTVTGPGEEIRLVNSTTGDYIYLQSNALGPGEVLTIDTRDNIKTLTLQDGTSVFNWLSVDSSMWALDAGSTTVLLQMTGTTAASGLTLSFKPKYLSP